MRRDRDLFTKREKEENKKIGKKRKKISKRYVERRKKSINIIKFTK